MNIAEVSEQLYKYGEDLGLGDIKNGIEQMFPGRNILFEEALTALLNGDLKQAFLLIFGEEISYTVTNLTGVKELFIWILTIGILASLLSRLSELFHKNNVSELSFYLLYLCQMSVLLESFTVLMDTCKSAMDGIITFIRTLMPAYLISVGIATGSVTASAGYEMMVLVIYGVEHVLGSIVLPLISAYMMLSVINGIWSEEKLSFLIDMIHNTIGWILKLSLGTVGGISIFQSALTPLIDSARASVLKKTVGALPGVGNSLENAVDLFVGSAVVIKNSVGICLLLLLLSFCVSPLLKLFLVSFSMKLAASLVGIVSDKRLTACANRTGEAGIMLFKVAGTAMLLFVVTLAIVSLSVKR